MNPYNPKPFSIRIFMPDGQADGLKIVEKSNWSGRGVVCPRALLMAYKTREEFVKTGVYILVGQGEEGGLPVLYIGQGDPVRPRLESHYAKKDFWQVAVFFVSKDDYLNKAHVGYLESRLISLAKEAKRCTLDNVNDPTLTAMSEMDVADAEGFLEELLLCLPALGVTQFSKPKKVARQSQYVLNGADCSAKGYESPEGFVVMAGGLARTEEVPSFHQYLSDLRATLIEKGIFIPEGKHLRLMQDYTFSSPSSASAIMLGRTSNGRIDWKTQSGQSLKEVQELAAGEL
jgi:hypothetical protein